MRRRFEHGRIYTETGVETAVLAEDERVALIGDAALAAPCDERIDLGGATMLPAFLDAHGHFAAAANSFLEARLEDCASWDDVAAAVREFVRANRIPAGRWVLGSGYDHLALRERRHPDRALLDAAAPRNPVLITHVSGHAGVMNGRALAISGVPDREDAAAGGRIGIAGGRANGYLEENALFRYREAAPLPTEREFAAAFLRAQALYASYGISTVQEGYFVRRLIPPYRALLAGGGLELDVVGYPGAADAAAVREAFPAEGGRLRIGGVKIFLDGSPQAKTAWMSAPYEGETDYRGYGTMTDAEVLAAAAAAQARGVQLLAHCNGDRAAEQFLRAVAEASRRGPLWRPVMIHAQFLRRDQIPELVRLGVIPSFFIAHIARWGDEHLARFGARARWISPAASALRAGLPFTFHQDCPVLPPDMLDSAACAVLRRTAAGRLLGGAERIGIGAALDAMTKNAAYQYGEEKDKGGIRPGKRADFVLLDHDPYRTAPERLREIRVLATYVRGREIWRR